MNFRSLRIAMLATAALLLAACIPELIADAGPDQAVNEGASVTVRAGANVLDHILKHDRVWVCRRLDVAEHWHAHHAPSEDDR